MALEGGTNPSAAPDLAFCSVFDFLRALSDMEVCNRAASLLDLVGGALLLDFPSAIPPVLAPLLVLLAPSILSLPPLEDRDVFEDLGESDLESSSFIPELKSANTDEDMLEVSVRFESERDAIETPTFNNDTPPPLPLLLVDDPLPFLE